MRNPLNSAVGHLRFALEALQQLGDAGGAGAIATEHVSKALLACDFGVQVVDNMTSLRQLESGLFEPVLVETSGAPPLTGAGRPRTPAGRPLHSEYQADVRASTGCFGQNKNS